MVVDFRLERASVVPLAERTIQRAKEITAQTMKEVFKEAEKRAKADVGKARAGLQFGPDSPVAQVQKSIKADDPIIGKNEVVANFGSFSGDGKLGVEASRENKGIDGSPFNFAVALNVGIKSFKLHWIDSRHGASGDGAVGFVKAANMIASAKYQAVTSETVHPGYTATGFLTNAFDFIDTTLEGRLIKALKEI
tara:strand:- start:224 stop:805 length:582 start_codon:yes stop_codon:yes gene_type:complete